MTRNIFFLETVLSSYNPNNLINQNKIGMKKIAVIIIDSCYFFMPLNRYLFQRAFQRRNAYKFYVKYQIGICLEC